MELADSNNMRYAIYVRKSTDEDGKQVRSLDDQVSDCQKLVLAQGLRVIGEPIRERLSAKQPNKRPLFKQLLQDVKDKKIDGIIAWHPDRLARNSIDSGKVIHLLDTGVIKDLKFVSHQFSNDANGKMLLGMLFVFAKHYSDDLSAKVTRGVRGNLGEGKSGGTPKHGYIREDNGFYQPDGKNFELMQQAWKMRAEGQSLDTISTYLNDHGYARYVKKLKGHSLNPMKPNVLEYVFKDTFYFGILNQSSQSVNLIELGIGFKPMIDREIYYKAQQFSTVFKRGTAKKQPVYLPLRHLVFCGECKSDTPMVAGRSK